MTTPSEGLRIYRAGKVYEIVGLKRNAIEQRMAAGDFPIPVILGPRSKGWVAEEIHNWVRQRTAMRDAEGRLSHPCA